MCCLSSLTEVIQLMVLVFVELVSIIGIIFAMFSFTFMFIPVFQFANCYSNNNSSIINLLYVAYRHVHSMQYLYNYFDANLQKV